MNRNVSPTIRAFAVAFALIHFSNVAIANPTRTGGNCNSCHVASTPASLVTPSPNPISIQKSHSGLLTLQVANLGQSSTAVLSVQGLDAAALNATVVAGGGNWTYLNGAQGTSWRSDSISNTGPYTMNISIGGAATVGTYPITVRFAGDGPYGSNTSFNLAINPAGVSGDYNGNGVVDAADYVLWRNGGPLQNEVDTPGTINAADFTAWRARFGNTTGSGLTWEISSVPEASTLALAFVGLLATLGKSRRRF